MGDKQLGSVAVHRSKGQPRAVRWLRLTLAIPAEQPSGDPESADQSGGRYSDAMADGPEGARRAASEPPTGQAARLAMASQARESRPMKINRKRATAVLGGIALAAAAAPVAHAQVVPTAGLGSSFPTVGIGASPCSTATAGTTGGAPGTPIISVCQAPGALAFVGPSIGEIATIVGPITIGAAVVGQPVASAGSVVTSFP